MAREGRFACQIQRTAEIATMRAVRGASGPGRTAKPRQNMDWVWSPDRIGELRYPAAIVGVDLDSQHRPWVMACDKATDPRISPLHVEGLQSVKAIWPVARPWPWP